MGVTSFLLLTFSSLFAVIDPPGSIPFFSGLTSHMDRAQKRRTLIKALITAFGVLALFTVVGHQLIELFGITLHAFRIAGGVILFGIGLDMLQSQPRRWRTGIDSAYTEDHPHPAAAATGDDDDPSVTPLGIPLLAGPGSITAVMALTPQGPDRLAVPLMLASLLAILVITGGVLMGADAVLARLGRTGLKIIEKLMGLLLTVIAVQLVIDGVTPVVRGLVS